MESDKPKAKEDVTPMAITLVAGGYRKHEVMHLIHPQNLLGVDNQEKSNDLSLHLRRNHP